MTIGTIPGYIQAIKNYVPTANTVKAIAKTKAQASILGPSWADAWDQSNAVSPIKTDQSNLGGTGKLSSAAPSGLGPSTVTTLHTPLQNYQDEILSDPLAQGAQTTYDTTVQGGRNQLRAALQQAVIGAGFDPGSQLASNPALAGYAGDIDQTTRDAAAANQLSTRQQLTSALNEGNYALPYQLAASGMGRSGALAIGTSKLQKQYETATDQGMKDLLNAIQGNVNTFTGVQNDAANALDSARSNVAQRLAQQAGYSDTVTTSGGGSSDDNPANGYVWDPAATAAPNPQTLATAMHAANTANAKESYGNLVAPVLKKIRAKKGKV